jgi:hypothetical protein
VYLQTRSRGAVAAMGIIVLLTAALLAVEWLLETPREAVARTLYEIAGAIEADDLPGVLTYIAPSSTEVRADAETLVPLVVVEKARILGTPNIDVDDTTNPRKATVNCQAMVNVVVKQNGLKGPYMDRVTIDFVERDGRWLIESYTPKQDWRRELRR